MRHLVDRAAAGQVLRLLCSCRAEDQHAPECHADVLARHIQCLACARVATAAYAAQPPPAAPRVARLRWADELEQ